MENAYTKFERTGFDQVCTDVGIETWLNAVKSANRYQLDLKPILDIVELCERSLSWGIKTRYPGAMDTKFYWYQVFEFFNEWIEELSRKNVPDHKKVENQAAYHQAADRLEMTRKNMASVLKSIVRSQGQSAVWVVNRYFGRISIASCRIESDYPILLDSWGRMAKGTYEEKTLGKYNFAFKIHFGNDVFLKFEWPRDAGSLATMSMYCKR